MTAAEYGKDLKKFALAEPFVSGYLPDGTFEGTLGGRRLRVIPPAVLQANERLYTKYILAAAVVAVVALALAIFSSPIWSLLALGLAGALLYKGYLVKKERQNIDVLDPLQATFIQMMREIEDCRIACCFVDNGTQERYDILPFYLAKTAANRKTCLALQAAMYSEKYYKETPVALKILFTDLLKNDPTYHNINLDELYFVRP